MEDTKKNRKFTGRPSEPSRFEERWAQFKRRAPLYRRALREWGRIHGRRITHRMHNVVAGNRAAGSSAVNGKIRRNCTFPFVIQPPKLMILFQGYGMSHGVPSG